MAKYLWQASYTLDGMKGVLKEGGTKRQAAVEKAIKPLKGKIEAFYYAFGSDDVIIIVDVPDNVSAAAMAMTVGAAGGASVKTTVLLTPAEIDAAAKKTVPYRKPGGAR
jgi:uncharacterized protein with GYD domain